MFGLTPFERKSYDLFNAFHDFENDFFGENALQSFKTDIKDEGDKYVMEAELPGFDKTISSLTSQATILFLPLSIRQRQRIRKTSISAVRGHTVLIREALTLRALIPTISPQSTRMVS